MAPFSVTKNILDQWAKLPLVECDLSGKIVVVVGASVGLGLEASRHFARMRPERLILACRDKERGDAAQRDIRITTGFNNVESWEVDLADLSAIKAFVTKFEENVGRIDFLLMNAGINIWNFERTKDGWEKILQTNHLGTSLLSLLLLPMLVKAPTSNSGPSPRLVIVTSESHFYLRHLKEADQPHILSSLNDECLSDMKRRYHVSKLFNIFFVRALVSRLPETSPLVVNAVNPGICRSKLARHATGLRLIAIKLLMLIARTTEEGSRTLVHASLTGTQEEMQGRYLNRCRVEEESDYAVSEEGKVVQERIWRETIDVLKSVDRRVEQVIHQHLVTESSLARDIGTRN